MAPAVAAVFCMGQKGYPRPPATHLPFISPLLKYQLICKLSENKLIKQYLLALGIYEITEIFSPLGIIIIYKKYELLLGHTIDMEIGWDLTSLNLFEIDSNNSAKGKPYVRPILPD